MGKILFGGKARYVLLMGLLNRVPPLSRVLNDTTP